MSCDIVRALMLEGRYGIALEAAKRALDGLLVDAFPERVHWLVLETRLCRLLGRNAEGLSIAVDALGIARRVGDPILVAQSLHAVGIALKGIGRLPDALRFLRQAERTMPRERDEEMRAALLLDLSELSVEMGDSAGGIAPLAVGAALAHYLKSTKLLTWSLMVRSDLERRSDAVATLAAALEMCRSIECPELEWQILWRLGKRAREAGRTRLHHGFFAEAFALLLKFDTSFSVMNGPSFWKVRPRRLFLQEAHRSFGPAFVRDAGHEGASMTRGVAWSQHYSWLPAFLPPWTREGNSSGRTLDERPPDQLQPGERR